MTKAHELHEHGQSIWLDYIRRSFIVDGGLKRAVEQGVRGVTSNPAIFEKAIAHSTDYDAQMRSLVEAGKSTEEIYEALAIEDIQRAADVLRPVYDESGGKDGFVSLEVSPTLAYETEKTIDEGRRLFKLVGRPNVMIKVPATAEGLPAITALIADGINVNVTLMFSLEDYNNVAEAYLKGLEQLHESGGDLSKVSSVASFFVSRVDGKVDEQLEQKGNTDLMGKIGIANSKAAYDRFKVVFSGDRWQKLADAGASVQRPLWASTSVKNPDYPETMYVDQLIGPHTVNTVPPNTLEALLDRATVKRTVDENMDEAYAQLKQLGELGIDLDKITADLQTEGVDKFNAPFKDLMNSIDEKRAKMQEGGSVLSWSLGDDEDTAVKAFEELRDNDVMKRVWDKDHTVWKDDPTEISNRLGWLTSVEVMEDNLQQISALVDGVKADGYTNVLLLGMGGSSLAPELFARIFGERTDGLELDVLDSTDPGAVLAYNKKLDMSKTLFIVATKSGGTAETLSFFKFFYNRVLDAVGKEKAGAHFVAITDPGSKLVTLAENYNFRATFLNDPDIGGRYSALSYFGVVPAALIGVDLPELFSRANAMATNCEAENCPAAGNNIGGRLGAIMGEMAKAGRDKLTIITSPSIASFGDWVEQLIAESTGKEGKGILPVVGEAVGAPNLYGDDRVFVYLRMNGDDTHDDAVHALEGAGFPVVTMQLDDVYDIGAQFFAWEMATAIAGERLGINPFDQPNVESAKVQARKMIDQYQETGKLPELEPTIVSNGTTVYADVTSDTPVSALKAFLDGATEDAYIALQAYITPTDAAASALDALRTNLLHAYKKATTVGFGPRFLHSTGQLHKGDAGHGMFIQITSDAAQDAPIPDEAGKQESGMSFDTLKMAQALGDRQALLDSDRRVIRFHFNGDATSAIKELAEAVS